MNMQIVSMLQKYTNKDVAKTLFQKLVFNGLKDTRHILILFNSLTQNM